MNRPKHKAETSPHVNRKLKYWVRCGKKVFLRRWFISIFTICVISSVTRPVTFPLREMLAINVILVGGEANSNCSHVEREFSQLK